jgi:hypothetical protein
MFLEPGSIDQIRAEPMVTYLSFVQMTHGIKNERLYALDRKDSYIVVV